VSILVPPIPGTSHGVSIEDRTLHALSMCCSDILIDDESDDSLILCAECESIYPSPELEGGEYEYWAVEWTIDSRTTNEGIKRWVEGWTDREVTGVEVTW
jgi:hypothetical protein